MGRSRPIATDRPRCVVRLVASVGPTMPDGDWITAEAACDRLRVKPQTLYAYVSRNLVQVRSDPDDKRRSLYRSADVGALAERKFRSRRVSDVAAGALAWGEPVLESALTTVAQGRPYYRGRDALRLAETETLESVARLLRGGHGVTPKVADRPPPPDHPDMRMRLHLALALRAATDAPARGRSQLALALEAATLLDVLTDAVTARVESGPIHARLASAWGRSPDGPEADLIRRILVLLADHELNPSVFAARVAASTGASIAAAALAGLATLSGPRHGGAWAAVLNFAEESAQFGAETAIRRRLDQASELPGFGHQLYPDGDPRASALLGWFAPAPKLGELAAKVLAEAGLRPNIDFALVAASQSMGLPQDAPFQFFSIGRCAGWISHALEQGRSDAVIRPRARYVGPEPETD